jgi:hypothetical protein
MEPISLVPVCTWRSNSYCSNAALRLEVWRMTGHASLTTYKLLQSVSALWSQEFLLPLDRPAALPSTIPSVLCTLTDFCNVMGLAVWMGGMACNTMNYTTLLFHCKFRSPTEKRTKPFLRSHSYLINKYGFLASELFSGKNVCNCMNRNNTREFYCLSGSQELAEFCSGRRLIAMFKSPPLERAWSGINPVHILTPHSYLYVLIFFSCMYLHSPSSPFPTDFATYIFYLFLSSLVCCVSVLSQHSSFDFCIIW